LKNNNHASRLLFALSLVLTACSGLPVNARKMTTQEVMDVAKAQSVETQEDRLEQEISSELLSRYAMPEDSLKRRAAEYLLAGLPFQWHYDTRILEESEVKRKVMDAKVVDADYLAENIEYAFKAWALPWACDLSFEDFCRYLLPYKMGTEAPERWRASVWEEYSQLMAELLAEEGVTPSEVCRRVNAMVREWYTIHLGYDYPADAGYLKAKEVREGTCNGASLMILYPLRALGVCATYDYVPQWGNRSDRHSWNALYEKGQLVVFNAPESDPGRTKQEFIGVGRMLRKRAKIFRKDYTMADRVDVTAEYVPTADLSVFCRWRKEGTPQLMVFDNSNWRSVSEGKWKGLRAEFPAAARGIAFLPAVSSYGRARALCWPLVVERNGRLKLFRPRLWRQTVQLTAKYPEDESNAIFPGEHYELFYWKGQWVSLGVQEATEKVLTYRGVPRGALLWLRNLDKGVQERIFTYEKGRQIWY